MRFYFIFFLLSLSLPHFWVELAGEVPKARVLAGYRHWEGSEGEVKIKLKTGGGSVLSLKVKGGKRAAQEMKISNYPDFRGARWRKYETELEWELASSTGVVTVYGVFKSYNKEKERHEITKVVHDTLNQEALERKLVRYAHGYMDYTRYIMEVAVEVSLDRAEEGFEKRYLTGAAQRRAEERALRYVGEMVKELEVLPGYPVALKLKNEAGFSIGLAERLQGEKASELRLQSLSYRDEKSVKLRSQLFFLRNGGRTQARRGLEPKQGLYLFLKPDFFPKLEVSKREDERAAVEALVLDGRGLSIKPAFFMVVRSSSGKVLLTGEFYGAEGSEAQAGVRQPFVRYLRSLRGYRFPRRSLFLSVYAVNQAGELVVSARHEGDFPNTRGGLRKLSNGNFYLLVD